MKKILSAILMVAMIAALAVCTTAAPDPAGNAVIKLDVFTQAEVIDDATTQDKGGNNTFISLMEQYGCGNSSLNDMVVFKDVDFGEYGVGSAKIHFGYGGKSTTKLGFYIDKAEGDPAVTIDVGNTGGWDKKTSGWVDVPLAVPAGKHTIYVKFMNEQSGSLSEIAFFEKTYMTLNVFKQAEIIDDATTQDKGGSGKPIQLMEANGVGYSSLNDVVVFKDVDFGKNGARAATMHFGYGGADTTKIGFYVDKLDGDAACIVDVGNTGGWDIKSSGWVNVPLEVPAGKHTIYVKFLNEKSGSISELAFIEAPAKPVNNPTADPIALTVVAAAASVALVAVVANKKH